MRKINRLSLDEATLAELARRGELVSASTDRKATAARLWKSLPSERKAAIRAALDQMSSGLKRCMYCEDSEGTDIEHFWPISEFPQHAFSWLNHLLACSGCNSNHKRTRFPLDGHGAPLLLDPTTDEPTDHLSLSPWTGKLEGLDIRGTTTINVCGLDREACEKGREDAWMIMCALAGRYAQERWSGNDQQATRALLALQRLPFQSVRDHLAAILHDSEEPDLIIPDDALQAFAEFPELLAR